MVIIIKTNLKKQREQDFTLCSKDWENLRKGQLLTYDQVERIYSYMKIIQIKKN